MLTKDDVAAAGSGQLVLGVCSASAESWMATCAGRDDAHACRPACSDIIPELEALIDRLPREAAPRPAAPEPKAVNSPPRGWTRIKGWGSALSLRKLKGRDGSTGKLQLPSAEGVGKIAIVGGGEGTHVGGRPRTGSVDSLRTLDTAGSRAASQRGIRPVSAADTSASPSLSQRGSRCPKGEDSPGEAQGLLGLLRMLGGPGSDSRPCKAQPGRTVGRQSDGVGEGGICRSIAEIGDH